MWQTARALMISSTANRRQVDNSTEVPSLVESLNCARYGVLTVLTVKVAAAVSDVTLCRQKCCRGTRSTMKMDAAFYPKHWYLATTLRGVISQKTLIT